MTDCQMIVKCTKCGYTTDEVFAVGGAVIDGQFFEITVSCPTTHRLVDGDAGSLQDFGVVEPDGSERYLTEEDVGEAMDPATAYMRSAVCPECNEAHGPWDAQLAVCPVCGTPGCQVEIARR